MLGRIASVVLIALTLSANQASAADDPCNLNDGSIAFGWQQVMDCYNSVPFNHDDLIEAVAMISASRDRSDEREIFEQRHGWRASIAALDDPSTLEDYASDYQMQLAIVSNHKEFLNPHWRYRRPICYTQGLGAFMPFDFGSDLGRSHGGKRQQIFFIEGAPFLPDLYEEFTGIDARQYVGMKILSINGTEPGEYFRQWARQDLRVDGNDGEQLNEVLAHAAYSMRVSLTHDLPPRQASDSYELETTSGNRVNVEMPWIFAPRAAFGLSQLDFYWLDGQERFAEACNWLSDVWHLVDRAGSEVAATAQLSATGSRAATEEFSKELGERRDLAKQLRKRHGGAGYFEVPPGQEDQGLEILVPHTDGAEVKQLGDRATIIHLDDFVQDWKEEVMAGTEYACEHSDRLIVDMRGNNGGYIEQIEWLAAHLFPERALPIDNSIPGRLLANNPGRNELSYRMGVHSEEFFGGSCTWWYEAACWIDPFTGEPFEGLDWLTTDTVTEQRAGVTETLSRLVGFVNLYPKYTAGVDTIACPGKFADSTLVLLSDGTGASAGYFWPEIIRDRAVMVTMGGFLGEPLVTGIARGGAVWPMNDGEALLEQLFANFHYGPALDPLPFMSRWVETYIEQPASYLNDLSELHVEQVPTGDIHIDFWSNRPGSDGVLFKKVLNAVQKMN